MNREIVEELKEHVPFTAAATAVAVIITAFLLIKNNLLEHAVSFFYVFHPIHIFFSAVVSAAIFYKYKQNMTLALITGVILSVLVGSVSDVMLPYIGSLIFRIPTSFHLPAIEKPLTIFGIAILGSFVGIIGKKTKFPHFLHVLISVFASLLYIFAYSTNFSPLVLALIFVITSVSVVIPCCLSDIILPIIFKKETSKNKK